MEKIVNLMDSAISRLNNIIQYKDISSFKIGTLVETPSGAVWLIVSQNKNGTTKVQNKDTKEIHTTQKIMCKLYKK